MWNYLNFLKWSVLVTALIKHCIKSFEFLFSWNFIGSFGMFIILSLVIFSLFYYLVFYFPCHLSFHFHQFKPPQVPPRQEVHNFLHHYHCSRGKNHPCLLQENLNLLDLNLDKMPRIKHLVHELKYTFSLVLKPFWNTFLLWSLFFAFVTANEKNMKLIKRKQASNSQMQCIGFKQCNGILK